MRLILRLDPTQVRRWHVRLAMRLSQRPDTEVGIEWGLPSRPLPSSVSLLFALERLVHMLPGGGSADAAAVGDLAQYPAASRQPGDLVLDLSGGEPRKGERTWQVTFDGVAGEAGALAALTESRTPIVAVIDAATGEEIASGHPGTETGRVLLLAFQDLLARTGTLVNAALGGAAPRYLGEHARGGALKTSVMAQFALRALAGTVASRLYHLCYNAPHWRVGWRHVDGAGVVDLLAQPSGGWRDLTDDGGRFYADPFPVVKDGRTHLFVEDFIHRLGRAIISVVEFDKTGPLGTPRPVLDIGTHLSYPFVFEHDGAMWMVPETGATRTIDLYRADRYPDRWVKEATMVEGLVASDATLFEHGGRWWMLATVQDDGGAFSDALHAWSAPGPFGPWVPHRRNPLLVDVATARPAGHVVRRDGRLIRPFQDCDGGYGKALGLAEITKLDDDGFAQRVEAVLRPGPMWPGRRIHTLNRSGWLECIDGSGTAPRFWKARASAVERPAETRTSTPRGTSGASLAQR